MQAMVDVHGAHRNAEARRFRGEGSDQDRGVEPAAQRNAAGRGRDTGSLQGRGQATRAAAAA